MVTSSISSPDPTQWVQRAWYTPVTSQEMMQVQKYHYVVELNTEAFKMLMQATKAVVIYIYYALTRPDICLLET